jgi:formylglycine-generating enzyme
MVIRISVAAALAAAMYSAVFQAVEAEAVTIDWVTVGNPGNAADTNPSGYGAVADTFKIMKYEWTNSQYVEFLNAVDPNGSNPNSIYNNGMANGRGGITLTGSNAAGSKYSARPNMGDKPVNWVSWWDAARVANWLEKGALSYGSTDATSTAPQNTGAYTLGTATSGSAVPKNVGAQNYIPTEDQWYKAAYYKASGTNAGYWDYATQTNTAPTAVTSGSTGIGSSGSTGNFANYLSGADWNSQDGNVTTVGTNGGASAYYAFDMGGNVAEWNDTSVAANGIKGLRGGDWQNNSSALAANANRIVNYPTNTEVAILGFRIAAVPEPSTLVMGAVGLACAGWGAFRRRKRA